MNTFRFAAVLLIVGFVAMFGSFVIGPKGIYQTPDLQRRIQIIEESKTRWNIAQSLIGLGLLSTAAGFSVLALHLRSDAGVWIPVLGAVIFAAGTFSGAFFLYRQTIDPLSSYQGAYTSFERIYYWLAIAGLLLFGIAFLQASLPSWLGYVTAGATIVYGIFFLVSGVGFPTPGLVVILSMVIAIVLLRQ